MGESRGSRRPREACSGEEERCPGGPLGDDFLRGVRLGSNLCEGQE